jgi:hypothetical protein
MMTYKELQSILKTFKADGHTSIKLNASKDVLQAEYDRLTAVTETTTETVETTSEMPVIESEVNNEIITDTSEIVIEPVLTITYHSFRDIIKQRKPLYTLRPKAQGFKIVKEKRYDQLTHNEWLDDTLAFLDDTCMTECDYMAA